MLACFIVTLLMIPVLGNEKLTFLIDSKGQLIKCFYEVLVSAAVMQFAQDKQVSGSFLRTQQLHLQELTARIIIQLYIYIYNVPLYLYV